MKGGASYFDGVYVEYSGSYGFFVNETRNVFVQCGGYANTFGWYIDTSGARNSFLGCIGASNTGAGAGDSWVIMGDENDFVACKSHNNARYGFYIYGAQENSFSCCRAYLNTNIDFYFASLGGTHSIDNIFSACQAYSTSPYGWRAADANQDTNVITSCRSSGHTTAEISANGSAWTEDNNI